jgi:hypothetical protein
MLMKMCVHFLFLYFHSKSMRKDVSYCSVCILRVVPKGSVIWVHSWPYVLFLQVIFSLTVTTSPKVLFLLYTSAFIQYFFFAI